MCLTFWLDADKMRIALSPVTASPKTIYIHPIHVSRARDLTDHFSSLSNSLALQECRVLYSTMSFAGPVAQDHVVVTNWTCDAREKIVHFTSLPFDLFPLDRRRFLNDLEAASYGVIARSSLTSLTKVFKPLWGDSKLLNLDGNTLVLFIGSGFGISYILGDDASNYNRVMSSEAGHSQACPGHDSDLIEFIRFVSQKLHGSSHEPEWEDLCAHRGLELALQYVKNTETRSDYAEVREMALAGDEDALKAFRLHYKAVARAAQSMVFAVPCQRVLIISEDQVKNAPLMPPMSEELHQNFTDHRLASRLSSINFFYQSGPSTFALSGGLFLSRVYAYAHQKQLHDTV